LQERFDFGHGASLHCIVKDTVRSLCCAGPMESKVPECQFCNLRSRALEQEVPNCDFVDGRLPTSVVGQSAEFLQIGSESKSKDDPGRPRLGRNLHLVAITQQRRSLQHRAVEPTTGPQPDQTPAVLERLDAVADGSSPPYPTEAATGDRDPDR
jgi:hypothetical protein